MLLLMTACCEAATDSPVSIPGKRKPITPAPLAEERGGQSYFEKYVKPKNINALISYCETQWMQEEKDSFCAMPEAEAIKHSHYWYDTWINKMWGILVNDSGVTANFNAYGIEYNEDKWLIILTSLHRKLNKREIDLTSQIKEVKNKRRKSRTTSLLKLKR
jgi:hypothetical protein